MPKPVRLRLLAAADLESAVDYYVQEARPGTAQRFIAAVQRAVEQIGRHPHRGSLRFAYELNIPELRARPLARFPYVLLYIERDAEIDVWRLLHSRRDVPPALADIDEQ